MSPAAFIRNCSWGLVLGARDSQLLLLRSMCVGVRLCVWNLLTLIHRFVFLGFQNVKFNKYILFIYISHIPFWKKTNNSQSILICSSICVYVSEYNICALWTGRVVIWHNNYEIEAIAIKCLAQVWYLVNARLSTWLLLFHYNCSNSWKNEIWVQKVRKEGKHKLNSVIRTCLSMSFA